MKKLILVAAVMSMTAASAFANRCEVDMVDSRTNRYITTISAYDNNPTSCLEAMKECRKEIRLRNLYGVADCINPRSSSPYPDPRPNPYPQNPGPQNPYPGQNYGITVTGLAENRLFTLTARDASELYINCLSNARNILQGSVDDIYFSVNNNRFVSRYTSGWYSDATFCSEIEREARNSYGQAYSNYIRVTGSIENYPFQIEANDRASLLNRCISTLNGVMRGSADDMRISLNGAPFETLYTSGWWNNSALACKALINKIDTRL